jgi:hypothetical protein
MSAFETYIQQELPQRPVLLSPANCGGYDGDPNDGGAPVKIQNSPSGTLYLRVSTTQLYQKIGGAGTWVLVGGTNVTGLAPSNREMTSSLTEDDEAQACATGLAVTIPGWVLVLVNGMATKLGNGTKVGVECFFSGDGGYSARATGELTAGDLLYWNGSVAGFQLNGDIIDFIYTA